MNKVLVISYNMVSHLYATAKLARLLNSTEGYIVDYACPDHTPSVDLVKTLLPKDVQIITVGTSLTKTQMNERVVADPLSWHTLWKALRNPLPLAEGVNKLVEEQEPMYEPIKGLIRAGGYDCIVTIHSACWTVCDAVESLEAEGESVPPCVVLNSMPYDPAVYKGEWDNWTEPRNLTVFPHVTFYPKQPTSFLSSISMRFWQALDTFMTIRAWEKVEAPHNVIRESRGLGPVQGQYLYYLRNYPCISFGGTAPFGDYTDIASNVTCIGTLEAPKDDQPISESLQLWLDDAKDEGVVYVGFGTGTVINEAGARAFTGNLLAKMKESKNLLPRILWALRSTEIARLEPFITDSVGEAPTLQTKTRLEYGSRLRIEAKLPQPSLLRHPNVKLFISHMGMGGFVEGTAAQTPFLCYPSGCDHYYNTRRAMEAGLAERIVDLNQLSSQVQRLWENDTIQENCQRAAETLLKTQGNARALDTIATLIAEAPRDLTKESSSDSTAKDTASDISLADAVSGSSSSKTAETRTSPATSEE